MYNLLLVLAKALMFLFMLSCSFSETVPDKVLINWPSIGINDLLPLSLSTAATGIHQSFHIQTCMCQSKGRFRHVDSQMFLHIRLSLTFCKSSLIAFTISSVRARSLLI